MMLTALALATVLAGPTSIDLSPTDDIWVYEHAGDPMTDPFLRIWGADGQDDAKDTSEVGDFSYSYLRWDLSKVPAGKLKSASLVLTHIPNPGWTFDYAKNVPLNARGVKSDFSEKKWDYAKIGDFMPDYGAKEILGFGTPEKQPAEGEELKFTVDLMKGPKDFAKYFAAAQTSASKSLALALTSRMDVASFGRTCIYKFYSKEADAAKRPVLKLTIEP